MLKNELAIDSNCSQRILFSGDCSTIMIAFPEDRPSCPSLLNRKLREKLRILTANQQFSLPDHGELSLTEPTFHVAIENDPTVLLAKIEVNATEIVITQINELSPIECRFLARNGSLVGTVSTHSQAVIRTDLHTHFAGTIRSRDLVEIGIAQNILYPHELLELAGISGFTEPVHLKSIPANMIDILENQLHIPLDRQITFMELEKIYSLRSPLTKPLTCFIPILKKVAENYHTMGIEYAEISFADIVNHERIALLNTHLPQIESENGIRIRFLGAIGRSNDYEWDLDYIERIKEVSSCPWIVGVDFLGHERNSTRAIRSQIHAVAQWADKNHPDFVIRVHAGENPAHPENIRVALETVQGKRVQIRIGHGLYGADLTTIELLKATNAIVEFNLNSNYALNNIIHCDGLPILHYNRHGIPFVLGTDGYGIYQTDSIQELKAFQLAGADNSLEKLIETEQFILNKIKNFDHLPEFPPMRMVHFTEKALAKKRFSQTIERNAFIQSIRERGISIHDQSSINEIITHKIPISFAGAWRNSWEKISSAHQRAIHEMIDQLLSTLSPDHFILITGGTVFGVESIVHEIGSQKGFTILGTVVADLDSAWIDSRISDAYLIADQFYEKASRLYHFIQDRNGWALFFGGGDIVADEIQTAHNLRLNYLLMNGPEGASTEYCRVAPHHGISCARESINALKGVVKWISSEGSYWFTGMNPTVDAVTIRKNPITSQREVLLVKRRIDSLTEAGKWALPGGFVHTDAEIGSLWVPGAESLETACLRELFEETSLDLRSCESQLVFQFNVDRVGRDPRDTPERWSRNSVFLIELDQSHSLLPICGNDDAELAVWCLVDSLPWNMAFDHREIIERVVRESISPR